MTPERKLAALFAADALPARDIAFEVRVAEEVARRRAWATVGALAPWAIAAGAVLWALQPMVGPLGDGLNVLAPPIGMLATAGATMVASLWLARRFRPG